MQFGFILDPVAQAARTDYPYVFVPRRKDSRQGIYSNEQALARNIMVREAILWCKDQFGPASRPLSPSAEVTDQRWGHCDLKRELYFRYERDAFAFKLRWD